jgi:autotransporter-associated beta strand protein
MNNGGTAYQASGGGTLFRDNSSAGNATIVNNGGAAAAYGALTLFSDSASAGNAILIANGGAQGGEGGQIYFDLASDGGTARVQVFGNGSLDISAHDRPGLTIGSVEGGGVVFLGGNNLTVGINGESTTYSGLMRDGGHPGGFGSRDTGGSLTKVGAGTLTMAGSNTYTGATTIAAGTLILNGSITSEVTVNGGMLGGAGTARAVTVNSGGTLSPGTGTSPGILSVLGNLKLSLGSTYLVDLNGTAVGTQYDQTNVTGTITLENATLSLRIGGPLLAGNQFTILNNDGTDAVLGHFSGLAEGASFMAGNQTFTISYQGNDGNDVILTAIVPEPATWVLLSIGTVFLLGERLRHHPPLQPS